MGWQFWDSCHIERPTITLTYGAVGAAGATVAAAAGGTGAVAKTAAPTDTTAMAEALALHRRHRPDGTPAFRSDGSRAASLPPARVIRTFDHLRESLQDIPPRVAVIRWWR